MKKVLWLSLFIVLVTACTLEYIDTNNIQTPQETTTYTTAEQIPASQNPTITIANWNIQVFGKTKSGKPEVMNIIAQTIAQYDLVAIEEVRDSTDTAMQSLESAVDALGTDYAYIIGPRLGRTASKEQYAVMYRTGTIAPVSSYTFPDPQDIFHREPLIAEFKTKAGNFTFVIITIHTDPDDATNEINALPIVVDNAQQHFPGQKDFIIVCDCNADCKKGTAYFDENAPSPLRAENYTWIITNDMDTTIAKGDCTYDRIIITSGALEDYTGHKGVDRFDTRFGLTLQQAKSVSDHYPIFAVFNTDADTD